MILGIDFMVAGFLLLVSSLATASLYEKRKSTSSAYKMCWYSMIACTYCWILVFLIRGICILLGITLLAGCQILLSVLTNTVGLYIASFFFMYLDLYLSILKMTIKQSFISQRYILALIGAVIVIYSSLSIAAFILAKDVVINSYAECFVASNIIPSVIQKIIWLHVNI